MATVCDLLEGAMLKRQALWNRSDGVAVIAEGLLEHMAPEELQGIEGVRIAHDSYGHLRLAEVDLAYVLKDPGRASLRQPRRDSRGGAQEYRLRTALGGAHRFRLRVRPHPRLRGRRVSARPRRSAPELSALGGLVDGKLDIWTSRTGTRDRQNSRAHGRYRRAVL